MDKTLLLMMAGLYKKFLRMPNFLISNLIFKFLKKLNLVIQKIQLFSK